MENTKESSEWNKSGGFDHLTHRYTKPYYDVPWTHRTVRSPNSHIYRKELILDCDGKIVTVVNDPELAERICRAINYYEDVE